VTPGAVQVAGVHDAAEARDIARQGVDFLGFPLRLAHHTEDCSEAEAARTIATLAPHVQSVLITYLTEPDEIVRLASALAVGWVQLHGAIEPGAVRSLRKRAPALRLAKSLVVRGNDLAALEPVMDAHAPYVDAFLTDSHDPATGAEGATGRTHDWSISRELARRSPHPLVLAGGLTPNNVRDAILTVRPAAVDAHTGVEGPDGRKDPELVARFVAEARGGFAAIGVGR
jgi:phosphoribosylanthranilate isomerase